MHIVCNQWVIVGHESRQTWKYHIILPRVDFILSFIFYGFCGCGNLSSFSCTYLLAIIFQKEDKIWFITLIRKQKKQLRGLSTAKNYKSYFAINCISSNLKFNNRDSILAFCGFILSLTVLNKISNFFFYFFFWLKN